MKPIFLLGATVCLASVVRAEPGELAVPRKRGLYVASLSSGRVRSLGDYGDWKLSPDKRLIVAGDENSKGIYQVDLLLTSTFAARRLERFRIQAAGGATFRWSDDSARVRVTSSRLREEKEDSQTFVVGRASAPTRSRERVLARATLKKLKARFPNVQEIAFSPDGTRVVAYLSRGFYQNRGFNGGLWLFRPDGSGLRRLTHNTNIQRGDFDDREAVWLDNGRLIFRRTSFEDEGI